MLDPRDLLAISNRCRQGTGVSDKAFGGLNILLFGDFKQLEPIGGIPLSNRETLSTAAGVHEGIMIFDQFLNVVTLTEVRRQADDSQKQFREVLGRLRDCKSTDDDYQFLRTRIRGVAPETDEIENGEYLYIVPTLALVAEHNSDMLESLIRANNSRKLKLLAIHNCPAANKKPADDYCGLESEIVLAIGARVMINNNIWTEKGLINGAFGTIRQIVFASGVGPPNLPDAIVVQMDEPYNGPCLPGYPRHVVLSTLENKSQSGNVFHSREQFPIMLSWAITICKCQGYNSLKSD
jgi:ATP-dependent DNA helicase PIF1